MLIPNNPSAVERQDKPLSPKETKPAGIPSSSPNNTQVEVSQSLSEEEFRRLQECVKANPEKSVPELTKLLYEEFNRDNSKNPVLQTTIQHWVSMFHLQR